MMPLALSYHHRAVDGADGARFLRWVAEVFEQPFLLSLRNVAIIRRMGRRGRVGRMVLSVQPFLPAAASPAHT